MPNWVHNQLRITGPKEKVQEFKKGFIEKGFEFTLPMPEEIRNTELSWPMPEEERKKQEELAKKYGHGNWHSWANVNWGTKWNANAVYLSKDNDNEVIFVFDTAWSEPIPWLVETSKKYPELEFKMSFIEPMNDISGSIICKNGEISPENEQPNY